MADLGSGETETETRQREKAAARRTLRQDAGHGGERGGLSVSSLLRPWASGYPWCTEALDREALNGCSMTSCNSAGGGKDTVGAQPSGFRGSVQTKMARVYDFRRRPGYQISPSQIHGTDKTGLLGHRQRSCDSQ